MSEPRASRIEQGVALRAQVSRSSHRDWRASATRHDPVAILESDAATRVAELLPFRYGRMLVNPFAFYRGAAAIMAHDLADTPTTGLRVQASGDAHVGNFGEFATPERRVVFDINDFDETLPGAWEWDVKRLAASIDLVARGRVPDARARRSMVTFAVRTYRERMAEFAELRTLDVWHSRITVEDVLAWFPPKYRPLVERDVARARRRTHRRAVAQLTEVVNGHRRFIESPPLVVRLENAGHDIEEARGFLEGYRESLSEDRRYVLDHFEMIDVARRAVGVGSVGMRCWVALFEGPSHPDVDALVLQVKEAGPSILEPYMGSPGLTHHGLRVITGQRLTQSASDPFLGWSEGPVSGRQYYVRQMWDGKGQGDPEAMDRSNLSLYGALCAWSLARAHARTGDPVMIAAYLGKKDVFDLAIADFAARYADQSELDHATLAEAVKSGRVEARLEP